MDVSLFLTMLFTTIPVSGDENPKTSAQWSHLSPCVRRQNPQFTAGYDRYRNRKYVDKIKVDFGVWGLYTSVRCNRENPPNVTVRNEGNNHWELVNRAYGYQTFGGLNPCATYRVHIDDSNIQDLTVGPYYKDTGVGKPTIGFRNNEYEKNLTRAAITVNPQKRSASIKLSPICAKTVQLEIVPENDKRSQNRKLSHIDPSRMEDIDFFVDELQPCTTYVVNLALSLETKNTTELEKDFNVYRKGEITSFSTLPNLEELKSPRLYDNASHFLSWDHPWEFLQHECAKPILDKNPKFTLTISKRQRNVNKVGRDNLVPLFVKDLFCLFMKIC